MKISTKCKIGAAVEHQPYQKYSKIHKGEIRKEAMCAVRRKANE